MIDEDDLDAEWEEAEDDPSLDLVLRTVRALLERGKAGGALLLVETAIGLSGPTEPPAVGQQPEDPTFYGWLTEATQPKSGAAGLIDLVLKRVTYKPGWAFAVSESDGVIRIHGQVATLNSRNGQRRIQHAYRPVGMAGNYMPAVTTEEDVMLILRRAIQEWECHEADEWLRLDGDIVHDPHVCRTCLFGGCRG